MSFCLSRAGLTKLTTWNFSTDRAKEQLELFSVPPFTGMAHDHLMRQLAHFENLQGKRGRDDGSLIAGKTVIAKIVLPIIARRNAKDFPETG